MIVLFIFSASSEIYTLSLHDALPIWIKENIIEIGRTAFRNFSNPVTKTNGFNLRFFDIPGNWIGIRIRKRNRSEEHTSELQSRRDLVCRLLLEKKKQKILTRL